MFNLGMGEITIIMLLALIFLGPKKLPELASGLGKLIREIRKTTADVKNEIQLDEAIRKPLEELREAVTLHPDELKRRDQLRRDLADLQKRVQETVASAPDDPAVDEGAMPSEGAMSGEGATAGDGVASDANATPPLTLVSTAGSGVAPGAGAAFGEGANLPSITASPLRMTPAIPGTAPMGTVARDSSGPNAPPAPPLAAVLAKGSDSPSGSERRPAVPPTGSDFLRSLRAVPEGRKPIPGRSAAEPVSAADRSNTTQALTEADLAAITVGPSPPPPIPNQGSGRTTLPPPPPPPRLPGATPPKNPNH